MKGFITEDMVEALAYGGVILGAGGGGSLEKGMEAARTALKAGQVQMVDIEDLADDDMVVTISGVGSPASRTGHVDSHDYTGALRLLEEKTGRRMKALIPSETGGSSSFGPFMPAVLGAIPVLDAACNGRAHPLGTMGSLGLNEMKATTVQAASGGDRGKSLHLELVVSGTVAQTASLVRSAAVQAGGLVAVARNPVSLSFVKSHAAVGAYSHSLEVGRAFLGADSSQARVEAVAQVLHGEIVCKGIIRNYQLDTVNGLDVGGFAIDDGKDAVRLYFWNEYMALDKEGKRVYTFPDFMMTFDAQTGLPFTTAELTDGKECYLVAAAKSKLLLGGGMYERSGYEAVENALGIDMVSYNSDIIR